MESEPQIILIGVWICGVVGLLLCAIVLILACALAVGLIGDLLRRRPRLDERDRITATLSDADRWLGQFPRIHMLVEELRKAVEDPNHRVDYARLLGRMGSKAARQEAVRERQQGDGE